MSSLLTNFEPQFFVLSNCTEYIPSKDEKYADCRILNDYEACDYLKDLHRLRSFSHYALGLIPLIISIFAFLINAIFIYICLAVISDKENRCRKSYLFNFTRSMSSIAGLLVYYCVLIAWKMGKLGKILIVILFTIGAWSFILQAICYIYIAITVYLSSTDSRDDYDLSMKMYFKVFVIIWSISAICGGVVGFLIFYLQYELDLITETIIQGTVFVLAPVLSFTYSTMILTMLLIIRKLRKNGNENDAESYEGNVTHINTNNNQFIYRLIYVIINWVLTKVSLIVVTVFCYISLDDLDMDLHSPCQRFVRGKLYIKISLFGGITLVLIIIGMISDPVIQFLCDFEYIKPLFWKEKPESLRNGKQEDE